MQIYEHQSVERINCDRRFARDANIQSVGDAYHFFAAHPNVWDKATPYVQLKGSNETRYNVPPLPGYRHQMAVYRSFIPSALQYFQMLVNGFGPYYYNDTMIL